MPLTEPYDDRSSVEESVVGVPAGEDAPPPVEPEPVLPEPVRQRIVTLTAAVLPGLPAAWNDITADFPREQTLHGPIEERAAATPDAVAVT
ncbi:hypothetical protein AB0F93_19665, partial [Micromonospora tulbaghiae]